jgi:hypothetical protein
MGLRLAFAIANVLMSWPIFMLGAAFLWGYSGAQIYGVFVIFYSVLSCITLVVAWKRPNRVLFVGEQLAIGILLLLALWFFLWVRVADFPWVFGSAFLAIFAIKAASLRYVFFHQTPAA